MPQQNAPRAVQHASRFVSLHSDSWYHIPNTASSTPSDFDKAIQPPIELLAPNRHLNGIERILHDVIRIQFIYPLHHSIDIRLLGLSEEQELDTGLCLETLDAEV